MLYVFIIVPRFIRDGVYNFIARNRYKWFGKKESCFLPTADLRNRFLS
ncbi:MAG: thiol-disulfide oxidoreductase DCC family protein [Chitinophagaceae bacterium]